MNLKWFIALLGLFLLNHPLIAQDSTNATLGKPLYDSYHTAVGLQLTGVGSAFAHPKGLSLKHFVSTRTALEINLTPGGRNIFSSNLAVQRHFGVTDVPQLHWYAGAGVNFEIYRYPRDTNNPNLTEKIIANTTTFMGVMGAEYHLPKLPFTISGDIKKGFLAFTHRGAINRYNIINGLHPCISFRYTFKG